MNFAAYSFFGASNSFFKKNSDKADAQVQSWLIFQVLKIEVSVANSIKIIDCDAGEVSLVSMDEVVYYVDKYNVLIKSM